MPLAGASIYSKKLLYDQQQRLLKIENDIHRTHSYFVQALNERRDSILREFHDIVQFVHKQNHHQAKSLSSRKSPDSGTGVGGVSGSSSSDDDHLHHDMSSNGGENGDCLEDELSASNESLHALINSHLLSIEFVTHAASIQAAVRNSFGFIR